MSGPVTSSVTGPVTAEPLAPVMFWTSSPASAWRTEIWLAEFSPQPASTWATHSKTCLSMKLSKAAETQRMSHRGFQSLCHIRVRTVQLPPTSL